MALVLTIVVLLILAAFTINTGKETIEFSRKTKIMAYMQLIQKKVDSISQSGNYNELGQSVLAFTNDKINNLNTIINEENLTTNTTSETLRYFNSNTLKEQLEVDEVDDEIVVDFATREVISLNGVKYDGKMYYSQYNLPGGQKIEQQTETTRDLELTSIEPSVDGLNAVFLINDINITNGTLSYTATHGETNPNNSAAIVTNYTVADETIRTDNITMSGTYTFKLSDNTSNAEQLSDPIVLRLTNSPNIKGNLGSLSNVYNYSNLEDSENWAYATDSSTSYVYVWIPRYAYKTASPTNIEFLKGTTELTTSGGYITNEWTIPEVFEDKTGVWVKVNSVNQTGLNITSVLNNATIL